MTTREQEYEAKLDHADELYGKALPERGDAQLEKIARLVHEHHLCTTDEAWKDEWDWATDAYANAMSGGSSLLITAKQIRDLCK